MDRSQILNDPEQAIRIALEGLQSNLWTALPCTVVSIDWTKLTIEAQPAVQGVNIDEAGNETYVNLPVLGDVPLMFPAAGGFALTFPIAAGDEVLVIFASRAIDSWWQSGGTNNQPVETRMHDLSDGFALPAQMSNPKSYGAHVSQANLRLCKQDGSSYVEIAANGKIGIFNAATAQTLGALLQSILTQLETLCTALASLTVAGVTAGGGTSGVPTNAAAINAVKAQLTTLGTSLAGLLE